MLKKLSGGEYALIHTGSNAGINTIIVLLPKSKRGMIVFTNGQNGDKVYENIVANSIDLGKEIIDRMK